MERKKHESEYLGMSRILAVSSISGPSEFHCTDKNQIFSTENSKTRRKRQIGNLTEEIKPVGLGKHEFCYQIEPKLQFCHSWSIKNPMHDQISWNFYPGFLQKHQSINCDMFWSDQKFSFGETWVIIWTFINIINLLAFSDYHKSNSINKSVFPKI